MKRILPLAKGESIQDFDVALSQIESIEEKASEVRAIPKPVAQVLPGVTGKFNENKRRILG